jgi:hypothetical protein
VFASRVVRAAEVALEQALALVSATSLEQARALGLTQVWPVAWVESWEQETVAA